MPALAQAYQCRVPDRITLPTEKRSAGPRLRGAIDGYILAVSWSPEYCRGDRASDPGTNATAASAASALSCTGCGPTRPTGSRRNGAHRPHR
jgi:ribonuclease I